MTAGFSRKFMARYFSWALIIFASAVSNLALSKPIANADIVGTYHLSSDSQDIDMELLEDQRGILIERTSNGGIKQIIAFRWVVKNGDFFQSSMVVLNNSGPQAVNDDVSDVRMDTGFLIFGSKSTNYETKWTRIPKDLLAEFNKAVQIKLWNQQH
jgi:hypothetical protein